MSIDRFAAFRKAPADNTGDLFEDVPVPAVPMDRGQEKPQKSAMSPLSPASPGQSEGASARFPLTAYMIDLMKHSDPDRVSADRAAQQYGLPVEVCRYYLDDERRRRMAGGGVMRAT